MYPFKKTAVSHTSVEITDKTNVLRMAKLPAVYSVSDFQYVVIIGDNNY